MKTLLAGLLFTVLLAWGVSFTPASNVNVLWLWRQEALHLTGFLAIAFMSLAMLLAIRPKWLEKPLGGLDKIYRTHKWSGILAVGFAVAHWFTKEVVGDFLKASIGKAGKVPKDTFYGIFNALRHSAKDIGEWAFYIFLAMLVLTLWKRFPYKPWRILHKVMPVIFLTLVFHSVMFVPLYYWQQPLGWLMAALMGLGVYASVVALFGQIGQSSRFVGTITGIEQDNNLLSLEMQMPNSWQHQAGQFAFLKFDRIEGGHPFTIASAMNSVHKVAFHIKALGDFTQSLASSIKLGQEVEVEGPYGQFQLGKQNPAHKQIWVAGGIGITSFLAWLESLSLTDQPSIEAELHYFVKDREHDPMAVKAKELCARLPNIELHLYGSKQGEHYQPKLLQSDKPTEVWYCGPIGLAKRIKEDVIAFNSSSKFHQELFDMR